MAKDLYHQEVRRALEEDGWIITHDPYRIKIFDLKHEIDIVAEKLLAAEKLNGKKIEKIAIEIKSFSQTSLTYEFHRVLGQYLAYIFGLKHQEPDRLLFLALPSIVYNKLCRMEGLSMLLQEYKVKIILFKENKIVEWIK